VINLLDAIGIHLPDALRGAPGSGPGHMFNLIAALIALAVAALLTLRTEWGARANTFIVAIKVVAVLVVIAIGVFYVNPANWHPFIPARVVGADGVGHFGFQGVVTAAAVVFFAVFGYDTLTTAAEESKNPQRDLPRAILLSLGISMALYIAITLMLTGMVPYTQLANDAPVASAFQALGMKWIGAAISVTAIASILSVIFAFMLAAARIWFALARDGLLPGWFAKVHPKYGTPHRPTIALGLFTAIVAALFPLGEVAKLVNIGVLSAFIVICSAVLVLRVRKPDLPRAFRTPWVPVIPVVGILFSVWLLSELAAITWMVFLAWVALGSLVYFGYGIRHSKLARGG
jgi:APA family basic amino acid/polyamine antiporter